MEREPQNCNVKDDSSNTMTQAIQCLDRILNDEQLMNKQGKEYFQATTPVTGKTKLEKAND